MNILGHSQRIYQEMSIINLSLKIWRTKMLGDEPIKSLSNKYPS